MFDVRSQVMIGLLTRMHRLGNHFMPEAFEQRGFSNCLMLIDKGDDGIDVQFNNLNEQICALQTDSIVSIRSLFGHHCKLPLQEALSVVLLFTLNYQAEIYAENGLQKHGEVTIAAYDILRAKLYESSNVSDIHYLID